MVAAVIAAGAVLLVVVVLLLLMRSETAPGEAAHEPKSGDYVASGGRLYRIEHVRRERVLIEDCGNGDLFDAGVAEVKALPLVKCSSGDGVSARTRRQAHNGRLTGPRPTGHRTV